MLKMLTDAVSRVYNSGDEKAKTNIKNLYSREITPESLTRKQWVSIAEPMAGSSKTETKSRIEEALQNPTEVREFVLKYRSKMWEEIRATEEEGDPEKKAEKTRENFYNLEIAVIKGVIRELSEGRTTPESIPKELWLLMLEHGNGGKTRLEEAFGDDAKGISTFVIKNGGKIIKEIIDHDNVPNDHERKILLDLQRLAQLHITQVQDELSELKNILLENLLLILKRGEELEELRARTQGLENGSQRFGMHSRRLHWENRWGVLGTILNFFVSIFEGIWRAISNIPSAIIWSIRGALRHDHSEKIANRWGLQQPEGPKFDSVTEHAHAGTPPDSDNNDTEKPGTGECDAPHNIMTH